MTISPQLKSRNPTLSSNGFSTTPAMRRFLIGFAIVEGIIMGWVLISTHLH